MIGAIVGLVGTLLLILVVAVLGAIKGPSPKEAARQAELNRKDKEDLETKEQAYQVRRAALAKVVGTRIEIPGNRNLSLLDSGGRYRGLHITAPIAGTVLGLDELSGARWAILNLIVEVQIGTQIYWTEYNPLDQSEGEIQ